MIRYTVALNVWWEDPGLWAAAIRAQRSVKPLPPVRTALMLSLEYVVMNGFMITLDIAPTLPPIKQHMNSRTDVPLMVMGYTPATTKLVMLEVTNINGTDTEYGIWYTYAFTYRYRSIVNRPRLVIRFIYVAIQSFSGSTSSKYGTSWTSAVGNTKFAPEPMKMKRAKSRRSSHLGITGGSTASSFVCSTSFWRMIVTVQPT
jgi:hypothetical protein